MGYFSDFNELEAKVTVEDQGSVYQTCSTDSIQIHLEAKGGLSFVWTPTAYLDDPFANDPVASPPPGLTESQKEILSCLRKPRLSQHETYIPRICRKSPRGEHPYYRGSRRYPHPGKKSSRSYARNPEGLKKVTPHRKRH